ncbi:MAG: DUF3244 domain-containing protein [Bacteroides sp.]|jgi:hypothetical protein|nr:DUF3244 domain-containing protein [Bacteroides sp.]MCI1682291.1 DUF3244 domain-containing protein [Bacteroides sp.]
MKANLLTILLSVLFIIPINAATEKRGTHFHMQRLLMKKGASTRSTPDFSITVEDKNNTLAIIFQSPLPNAEVSITDSNGNTVINEPHISIYEGKVLYIHAPNAYPYMIEITSPSMDVSGEITQEISL